MTWRYRLTGAGAFGRLLVLFVVAGTAMLISSGRASAQEHVTKRLEDSPRHHEWATVTHGEREVRCFIAFPEVEGKAHAVLVIHENKGLTDWVRGVADQLAEHGYIAIAPDLLSGHGPEGGGTEQFDSADAATRALYEVDQEQVTADLNAVADHVIALPACDGTLSVAGFCWGGGQTFRFATDRDDLQAACVFYGRFDYTAEDLARIDCPVYGFYGGDDARINATIPATEEAMEEAGKEYEPVIYDGAGHGFMRRGEEPGLSEDDANRKAREEAWERWKKILADVSEDDDSSDD